MAIIYTGKGTSGGSYTITIEIKPYSYNASSGTTVFSLKRRIKVGGIEQGNYVNYPAVSGALTYKDNAGRSCTQFFRGSAGTMLYNSDYIAQEDTLTAVFSMTESSGQSWISFSVDGYGSEKGYYGPALSEPDIPSDAKFGDTLTIGLPTRSNILYKLTYQFMKLPGGVTQVAKGTITNGTGGSYNWQIPLSLIEHVPTSLSGDLLITCETLYKGESVGFSKTKRVTVTSSSALTMQVEVTEGAQGFPSGITGYVAGKSALHVTVTPQNFPVSLINRCATRINGIEYTGLSFTSNTLRTAGSCELQTTLTDKSGRTATATQTVTVQEYSQPAIIKADTFRCAGAEDPTVSRQGSYGCVRLSGSVASLNSQNDHVCTVYYKKSTEQEYTAAILDVRHTFSDICFIFQADTSNSYDIYVTLSDSFATVTYYCLQMPSSAVLVDIAPDGNGIAFFKMLEGTGMEIGAPMHLYGGLSMDGVLPAVAPAQAINNAMFKWSNSVTSGLFCPIFRTAVADGQICFGVLPGDNSFAVIHVDILGNLTIRKLGGSMYQDITESIAWLSGKCIGAKAYGRYDGQSTSITYWGLALCNLSGSAIKYAKIEAAKGERYRVTGWFYPGNVGLSNAGDMDHSVACALVDANGDIIDTRKALPDVSNRSPSWHYCTVEIPVPQNAYLIIMNYAPALADFATYMDVVNRPETDIIVEKMLIE